MLTVSEARRLGVCRVCGDKIKSWPERLYVILTETEYAHVACLTPERLRAEQLERRALDHLIVRP